MPNCIVCSFRKTRLISTHSLERRVLQVWYGNSIAANLLQPLAYVFAALVALRRWAYKHGFFAQEDVSVPVIVVGNITVGGTGKTPLVAWLAQRLTDSGYRPGIVSRGYGGSDNRTPRPVDSTSNPAEVGDEALVLARQTHAPVCVCTDRVAAARHLLAQTDVNIVIADDGLQHYRLARDIEIVVLDGDRMLGNGRFLPAGPLRESVDRLQEVDLVLINGKARHQSDYAFNLAPQKAVELNTSKVCALSEFSGSRVWAVAGIGNPKRFFEMLISFGIEPIDVNVSDHGEISLEALRQQEAYPILMTEKDAVKYLASPVPNAWYVPVSVAMPESAQNAVMELIQKSLKSRFAGG